MKGGGMPAVRADWVKQTDGEMRWMYGRSAALSPSVQRRSRDGSGRPGDTFTISRFFGSTFSFDLKPRHIFFWNSKHHLTFQRCRRMVTGHTHTTWRENRLGEKVEKHLVEMTGFVASSHVSEDNARGVNLEKEPEIGPLLCLSNATCFYI